RLPRPNRRSRHHHQHPPRRPHGLPLQPRPLLAPPPLQLFPPPQLDRIHRPDSRHPPSAHPAPKQNAEIPRPRPHLPHPLPATTPRKHHRRHRPLHSRPRGHHLLLPYPTRPPHLESLPLHRLFRSRRALLPLALHRSRPKRRPHPMARRRQTLRRILRPNHRSRLRPPRPPLPKKIPSRPARVVANLQIRAFLFSATSVNSVLRTPCK